MRKVKKPTSSRATPAVSARRRPAGQPAETVDKSPRPAAGSVSEVEEVRRELRGAALPEPADEPNIMAQRLDSRPFSSGSQVANQLPQDDQTTERMVEGGVEDAEDDEINAASKRPTSSEG